MIARQGVSIWFQFKNCTNACQITSRGWFLLFHESQCSLTCSINHLDQVSSG
ncbi:MAG: hypothetical protein K0S23_2791 [Fluviicola sp.]|jgi:hypothetical protein|nr:hypothetical protein [Fluviicola sp.]